MPTAFLRGLILGGLETASSDVAIRRACAFMEERLDSLCQTTLASRLSINCASSSGAPSMPEDAADLPVTIVDVWDESALTEQVKESVRAAYPHAKLAMLKTGGNFPFLSRSEEVNLHLIVRSIKP